MAPRRTGGFHAACGVLLASLAAGPLLAGIVEREDVVYAQHDGVDLALDIAYPEGSGPPRPLILCIHGGAWRGGHRKVYKQLIRRLAEEGYVAATVSYRLTATHPWPAQLADVRAALRWLRERAVEFGADPRRVGVTGHSAGGHLSLMLGVHPGAAPGGAEVQAVVNHFGPTDMRSEKFSDSANEVIRALAGGSYAEKKDVYWEFSPVVHVSRGDAPVLTFHGSDDPIVPSQQARLLHRELDRAGVPNRLEVLQGRSHGWDGEDRAATNRQMLEFFDLYLRGSELPLHAIEDFEGGAERWQPTDPRAWEVRGEAGGRFYSLARKESEYRPKVRSPYHIALLGDVAVGDFVLDVRVRSTTPDYGHRDVCLFFGYQDPAKFYYVHLGKKGDDHANSIFIVNDAPRVSIARERTMGTDWDDEWHRVRIVRSAGDGAIEIFFDDMTRPVMAAVDKTFLTGRIGVGSFDDTADFDEIRLRGNAVQP